MEIREALTFDDVLLVPEKSNVVPSEVDTTTNLTSSIKLNIPLLSSALVHFYLLYIIIEIIFKG